MKLFYRISPSKAGYKKDKPEYINNENCLNNYIYYFCNTVKDYVNTTLISDIKDFENLKYTKEDRLSTFSL